MVGRTMIEFVLSLLVVMALIGALLYLGRYMLPGVPEPIWVCLSVVVLALFLLYVLGYVKPGWKW